MRYWMIGLMALWMTGCDLARPAIERDFADYIQRIANVQDAAAIPFPDTQNQTLPDKRNLLITIDPLTLGLLDSYELRKCALFSLIAERNSVLGKVQDEFRRFDYELALLHGLTRCITDNDLSPKLRQQLSDIEAEKIDQLPAQWHNLLYTSTAMRQQLTSHEWLEGHWDTAQINEALTTFSAIHAAIAQQQLTVALPVVTPYQEALEKQPLLGQLKFSLDNSARWLSAATQQLTQHDATIVCGANRNPTKLNYLRNVFQSIYVEKLQPYLAKIDSIYVTLAPNLTPFEPTPLSDYAFAIVQSHQAFRQAIQHHMQYWQALFKRCSVTVGR
ncbi:DUF3080 domain-containing protein [Vibrio furnissii]|uniref:DUF3080 domain-containing protein n=1 Tax=Vibrio furnissii TaxID=29494 RepID=UPI003B986A54